MINWVTRHCAVGTFFFSETNEAVHLSFENANLANMQRKEWRKRQVGGVYFPRKGNQNVKVVSGGEFSPRFSWVFSEVDMLQFCPIFNLVPVTEEYTMV